MNIVIKTYKNYIKMKHKQNFHGFVEDNITETERDTLSEWLSVKRDTHTATTMEEREREGRVRLKRRECLCLITGSNGNHYRLKV